MEYNELSLTSKVIAQNVDCYYTYDALGTKLRRKYSRVSTINPNYTQGNIANDTTRYYVDGIEFIGTTPQIDMIIFADGFIDNSLQTYYYTLKDHLGSIRKIISKNISTGVINNNVESATYLPFGGFYNFSGSLKSLYFYNGKEIQNYTGFHDMHDYGACMYSSGLGRWFGVDPILDNIYDDPEDEEDFLDNFAFHSGLYNYVLNNPVNFTDFMGFDSARTTLPEVVVNSTIKPNSTTTTTLPRIEVNTTISHNQQRSNFYNTYHIPYDPPLSNFEFGSVITFGVATSISLGFHFPQIVARYFLENKVKSKFGKKNTKGNEKLVGNAAKQVKNWLGKEYKVLINKKGDYIFISNDGLRKMRFDIKNSQGDKPHIHLEEYINGKWNDAIPNKHRIYPKQ